MTRRFARTALCTSIALALSAPAHAARERVGPIDPSPTVGGFPAWFQDKTGLAIEFCDLKNMAELNGGWCTLIPPTPSAAPETFPSPFFVEHFYWNGVATATAGTARAKLVLAMEASFANGTVVQPGDQVVFGLVRVDINRIVHRDRNLIRIQYRSGIQPDSAHYGPDQVEPEVDLANGLIVSPGVPLPFHIRSGQDFMVTLCKTGRRSYQRAHCSIGC